MTKISSKRLVVAGSKIDLKIYEYPIAYNFTPFRKTYTKNDNQESRRKDNLIKIRSKINYLIESNYKEYGYLPIFLTFTFKENITDLIYANEQYTAFQKRFNYYVGKNLRYITIIEFQKRGAVHYHSIFFDLPISYESQERTTRLISSIWRNGFVDIERIRSAKAVAPYVCKYITKNINDKRLFGRKSFFCSNNLFKPTYLRDEQRINDVLDEIQPTMVQSKIIISKFRGKIQIINYDKSKTKSI